MTGYRKVYTEAEWEEIIIQRAELRERLTCPDSEYDEVCRRHQENEKERAAKNG